MFIHFRSHLWQEIIDHHHTSHIERSYGSFLIFNLPCIHVLDCGRKQSSWSKPTHANSVQKAPGCTQGIKARWQCYNYRVTLQVGGYLPSSGSFWISLLRESWSWDRSSRRVSTLTRLSSSTSVQFLVDEVLDGSENVYSMTRRNKTTNRSFIHSLCFQQWCIIKASKVFPAGLNTGH